MPRLEGLFQRIAVQINYGFTARTESEETVNQLRVRNYFIDSDRVDDDIFTNSIHDDDVSGDPYEEDTAVTAAEISEYLESAVDLLNDSMPKWFARTPKYWPRRRVVAAFLEANALIPITERGSFAYLVKLFLLVLFLCLLQFGAQTVPASVLRFQCFKNIDWTALEGNSIEAKIANKTFHKEILAEQIAAKVNAAKPLTQEEIKEALQSTTTIAEARLGLLRDLALESGK